ncbi:DmsC/YnfH family molybdoenzyme membrane anchor subunit [Pseudoruegeria sp. HB172150]|uniref:dimethyl sulfoxide reductase anchor subunit family protein n=1 Tax=Pseudoruegeria sp. HB172150 TaxID=2721164 RepID=UPI0015532E07|nr:DmsC/YnfH family molybdoenzyme membrane anchor subunit [Pseudoruegeria sp. HB172150]
MHPAYSVIFFTTASGAGYGLLFWLSLAHLLGLLPGDGWTGFTTIAVALVLITMGLLSSTLHLGRPERAIRAFSQWRSSWLSREGVAAVATYVPSGLLALFWLTGTESIWTPVLALLSAAGAVVTVYCTGMIYASLRTIRQWNLPLVPLIYLVLSAASGALLFALFMALFGYGSVWIGVVALLATLAAGGLKIAYFAEIDGNPGRYTAAMALGLGKDGIRQLDPPHTRPNFVMREMGYSVARKHAQKLRRLALLCLCALPVLFTVAALLTPLSTTFYLLAVLSAALGLVTERWLFFAEAEHVSMLYYGAARA